MIQEYCIQGWGSYIDVVTEITEKEQYRMWYRGQAECLWADFCSKRKRTRQADTSSRTILDD